jgi:prostaglandin-endoperoxide synthase 2
MMRDRSRDGIRNRLEFYVATHFAPLWREAQRWRWSQRRLNRLIVSTEINRTRTRPHPHSTLAPYTTWQSLTDRNWCGRHLPPKESIHYPDLNATTELFRRPSGKPKLSQKSTLLFPTFAQWAIDGFVRTSTIDQMRSTSNHEIDFSPLYGLTPEQTEALRSHWGGELKSQQIADQEYPPFLYEDDGSRIKPEFQALPQPAHMPEGVPANRKAKLFALGGDRANATPLTAMLSVLFLREHNRVSRVLRKRHANWDDERLFQTTRNVLMVLLIKIAVEQYINHIAPCYFQFTATPELFWREKWYRQNWMTLEFNLAYRWHSMIPDLLNWGSNEIPFEQFRFNNELLLQRGVGPAFDDCSRQKATEIGLGNTPMGLLEIERKSIELGRTAQLASYNDYRESFRFPRLTSFDQITGDEHVQRALKDLYGSIDQVEFYVGLYAEDMRPHSVLPPLMERMIAIDAFSQAYTNPLLSEHVFNAQTFSNTGMSIIQETSSLQDVLDRNLQECTGDYLALMTVGASFL